MGSYRKFSAGLLLICVFSFTKAAFPESTQLNDSHTFQEKLRVKRQGCQDGTYEHEGINCCKCAAGQRVEEHCINTANDGRCVFCERNTYNSEPNSKISCEICTSCDQANANLEEKEPCTPLQDRKCRCKEGHYCNSAEGSCKICHPCNRCSSTGVKEPCTLTRDAICKEESTGLSDGAVAGIVIVVLVFVIVFALGVMCKKKILGFWKRDASNPPGPVNDPLLPVDMEPHIVEVAEIIGWKVMSQIALSCKMANTIDNVRLSHPNDSEMWTQELLRNWMERKGTAASVELIKTLRKMRHNNKADQIKEKLYPIDSPTQCSSA